MVLWALWVQLDGCLCQSIHSPQARLLQATLALSSSPLCSQASLSFLLYCYLLSTVSRAELRQLGKLHRLKALSSRQSSKSWQARDAYYLTQVPSHSKWTEQCHQTERLQIMLLDLEPSQSCYDRWQPCALDGQTAYAAPAGTQGCT